jgi:Holliday junction resolvase RusA-like endonuclease
MKLIYSANLPVRPQSKQSTRFFNDKNNGKLRSCTDPKKANYVRTLSNLARVHKKNAKSEKPLALTVTFKFKHSKKRGYRAAGADLDNLLKPLKDSMNKIIYKDDKQIVSVMASKFYSEEDSIEVLIHELPREGK